jgi:hypoxia up-regulated 1
MIKVIIGILFLNLVYFSNCTVMGIDFGSEYSKASIISPGKTFEIIENETSKRKTQNSVSINNIDFFLRQVEDI